MLMRMADRVSATLSVVRTKATTPGTLSSVDSRGMWWPLIRESVDGAWQTNVTVDLANVVQYAPVYACVRLIATDIGKLRLRLMEQDEHGLWSEVDSAAFSPFLRKPNHYQTRLKFIQTWVTTKLLHGNAYVLKQRDLRGLVVAGYVLDPTRVRPLVADDGSIYYQLQGDNLSGLESSVTVPASEIIHDVHIPLYHPLVGVSPITACGVAAVEALRIQENSAIFFGNGSRPGGILLAPGHITLESAERMKTAWDAAFSGENVGKVAVLGDGLKYEALTVNATDAQLIEQLKWTAEDVCQAFGVPRHKIGVGPDPTYQNIESLNIDYYSRCLQELIENIEDLLDFGLGLAPDKVQGKRLGVEFDLDDLIRMDTGAKADAATKAITSGLSPNEVRKRYWDAPPVSGGELPFMQEQNWPIRHLAERPLPTREITPPAETPEPEPEPEDVAEDKAWVFRDYEDVRDVAVKHLGLNHAA